MPEEVPLLSVAWRPGSSSAARTVLLIGFPPVHAPPRGGIQDASNLRSLQGQWGLTMPSQQLSCSGKGERLAARTRRVQGENCRGRPASGIPQSPVREPCCLRRAPYLLLSSCQSGDSPRCRHWASRGSGGLEPKPKPCKDEAWHPLAGRRAHCRAELSQQGGLQGPIRGHHLSRVWNKWHHAGIPYQGSSTWRCVRAVKGHGMRSRFHHRLSPGAGAEKREAFRTHSSTASPRLPTAHGTGRSQGRPGVLNGTRAKGCARQQGAPPVLVA